MRTQHDHEAVVPAFTAPAETMEQFKAALESGGPIPPDLWAEVGAIERAEWRKAAQPQVWALINAGWRFELPDSLDPEPWQWYWRRPPRRKGSQGRKYLSTQQAYNALMREAAPE